MGVLSLLAEIARGSTYVAVHGNRLRADHEQTGSAELSWVRKAHDAVAAGYTQFARLTNEAGDVRFAAAHVLAQLPEHAGEVAAIIRTLLQDEQRIPYRAGLLLVLGSIGDRSTQTLTNLSAAVNSTEKTERRAAAFSITRLKVQPLPEGGCTAIMDAIATDDLETSLQELPWDATRGLDNTELFTGLDGTAQDQVIDQLIASLETDAATVRGVEVLVRLLFPSAAHGRTPKVTADRMTIRQFRAVRAICEAMKGGKRIFYGHFSSYGLPETMREWRALASGREPPPVDESLPLLATASRPRTACVPGKLKVGQKVIHRYLGPGTVIELKVGQSFTELTDHFDEEGDKGLMLPTDGSF